MAIHLYLGPDLGDFSVAIDEIGDPFDTHVGLSVHAFLAPYPIGFEHLMGLIGNERKGERVFIPEFVLSANGVRRNAENRGADLFEGMLHPIKGDDFLGTSRCIGLGIEEEHHFLSLQLFERDLIPAIPRKVEVRSGAPDSKQTGHMPSFRRLSRIDWAYNTMICEIGSLDALQRNRVGPGCKEGSRGTA